MKRAGRTVALAAMGVMMGAGVLAQSPAALGAQRFPTGAPLAVESVAGIETQRPDYTELRDALDTLEAARTAASEARFARVNTEQSVEWWVKERDELREELADWTPPDVTDLPEDLARWDLDEDARAKRTVENDLDRLESLIAAHPAELSAAIENETRAEARVEKLEADLAPAATRARTWLITQGLPDTGEPPQIGDIGLAEGIATWQGLSGRAFGALSLSERAWLVPQFTASTTSRIDAKLEWLGQLTRSELREPVQLGATFSEVPSAQARARGRSLEAALGRPLGLLELRRLERLDDASWNRFVPRLEAMIDAGFAFEGIMGPGASFDGPSLSTELEALVSALAFPRASMSVGGRSIRTDAESLIAAARAWTARGETVNRDALPLLAVLSAGGEPAERAERLLERLSRTGYPSELGVLARLAAGNFAGRGLDARALDFLDRARAEMGRPLRINEAASLLNRHFGNGGPEIDPDGWAQMRARDPEAGIADAALWKMPIGAVTRSELVRAIEARLPSAPTPRLDRAKEYGETFAEHVDQLTLSDLVRIDRLQGALETPEVRASIGEHLQEDLRRDDTELGGVWVASGDALRFRPVTPEKTGSDNAFSMPDHVDVYDVVLTAHFHATRDVGNAGSAGPSSAFGGRAADRNTAFEMAKSDLVITHLGAGRFGADYYTPNGAVVDLGQFSYRP